jgi:DNA replication protein DnaC
MNREVMKSMGTKRIPVDRLTSLLQTFALKHAAKALPDLLETADLENATNKQFLLSILETEVIGRNERRRKRNYSAAHFPPNIKPIEEFNPDELDSGISQAQVCFLQAPFGKSCNAKMDNLACPKWTMLQPDTPACDHAGVIPL